MHTELKQTHTHMSWALHECRERAFWARLMNMAFRSLSRGVTTHRCGRASCGGGRTDRRLQNDTVVGVVLQAETLAYKSWEQIFLHQKHEIICGNFSVRKTSVENKPCVRHQNRDSDSLIHNYLIFATQLSGSMSVSSMKKELQKD